MRLEADHRPARHRPVGAPVPGAALARRAHPRRGHGRAAADVDECVVGAYQDQYGNGYGQDWLCVRLALPAVPLSPS